MALQKQTAHYTFLLTLVGALSVSPSALAQGEIPASATEESTVEESTVEEITVQESAEVREFLYDDIPTNCDIQVAESSPTRVAEQPWDALLETLFAEAPETFCDGITGTDSGITKNFNFIVAGDRIFKVVTESVHSGFDEALEAFEFPVLGMQTLYRDRNGQLDLSRTEIFLPVRDSLCLTDALESPHWVNCQFAVTQRPARATPMESSVMAEPTNGTLDDRGSQVDLPDNSATTPSETLPETPEATPSATLPENNERVPIANSPENFPENFPENSLVTVGELTYDW